MKLCQSETMKVFNSTVKNVSKRDLTRFELKNFIFHFLMNKSFNDLPKFQC